MARNRVVTKWTAALGACVGGAYLLCTGWRRRAEQPAEISIPPAKAEPSPNGFRLYLQAAGLLDDRLEHGAPTQEGGDDACPSFPLDAHTPAEEDVLVRQNAAALEAIREALRCEWLIPPDMAVSSDFSRLGTSREVVRLLVMESHVRMARGDAAGAVSSCLDAIELGCVFPRGGPLIYALVGIACEAIGRAHAVKLIDSLDAAQARQAALRMEDIAKRPVALADVLREEKRFGCVQLTEDLNAADWRKRLFKSQTRPFGGEPSFASAPWQFVRIQFLTKRGVAADYMRFMDESVVRAQLPWSVARKMRAMPCRSISGFSVGIFEAARAGFENRNVQSAFLAAALALRAYQVEHGRYPDELSELAPDYLTAVPGDPFADGTPLRYRRKGDGYLLYSIGPDCKDDGGRPFKGIPGLEGRPAVPTWRSKGDIVFTMPEGR